MADISKKLGSKFNRPQRYANFGPCVNSIKITGFRGVNCTVNFDYPITAITGLNGAGKSTIGQLLLCGYKKLSTADYKRWYVKDFFPVSVADPSPITDEASVEFRYQTSAKNDGQALTVSRAVKEWSGYKRQPEKAAIYVGLAFYLPKVERRDLTIYNAKTLTLTDRTEIDNGAQWATRILGNSYNEVFFQGVESPHKKAELSMAIRGGATYSENNMGFGEGRVIHTIRLLESCPNQSLIVLEEPETSLHEFAQYEFAKYLMDVSFRRGHQIVFSTHSSPMISALPPEGRRMISREGKAVRVYDRLSSVHIRNALTEGNQGHLIICVEDEFAQSLLREIIRMKRKELLRRVRILPFGDAIAVKGAVQNLKQAEVPAIAVRDGDQPVVPEEDLFALPGKDAPEKVVFHSEEARNILNNEYGFDLEKHITAHPDEDHHVYSSIVAKQTAYSREVIESDCIRAFLDAQPIAWASGLLEAIEGAFPE